MKIKSSRPARKNNDTGPAHDAKVYFIVAALAIYEKDGAQKQRHMNILLQQDAPALTKDSLAKIQHGAMARLFAENNVDAGSVKDVVILSINLMGLMTQEEFEGSAFTETPPSAAH